MVKKMVRSKKPNINKVLRKGKCFMLAYDQGLEHGPTDFTDKNADPAYIIDLAKKGKATAIAMQKGVVEKYQKELKAAKVPLILKLNGKTRMSKGEPYSTQLCTVDEAIKLGATAVGYTIYFGSEHEAKMLDEFEEVQKNAHAKGLPVVVWSYPRGKAVPKVTDEVMAYAARAGLEVGADMAKINYSGHPDALKWAVKVAGRTKVVISGGVKKDEKQFLSNLRDIMKTGAAGISVGRNVWQHKDPLYMAGKIRKIIWGK